MSTIDNSNTCNTCNTQTFKEQVSTLLSSGNKDNLDELVALISANKSEMIEMQLRAIQKAALFPCTVRIPNIHTKGYTEYLIPGEPKFIEKFTSCKVISVQDLKDIRGKDE